MKIEAIDRILKNVEMDKKRESRGDFAYTVTIPLVELVNFIRKEIKFVKFNRFILDAMKKIEVIENAYIPKYF